MTERLEVPFEKRFNATTVVRLRFAHAIERGAVTVLYGPSGCGKSTVLRCLAGLEQPQQGVIRLGEQLWFDRAQRVSLRPQQRRVGLLSQNDALFPHLTVAENIGFGLRAATRQQRCGQVDRYLARFELPGLGSRLPHQISGGQRQRVALARALASRPRLLLLDEPLSALDSALRERLRDELRQQLAAEGLSALVVTHDRNEAIALADQMIVMTEGTIRQMGAPDEVFSRPVDQAVAALVGVETVLPAKILSSEDGLVRIAIEKIQLLAVAPHDWPGSGPEVYACIRGEEVMLQRDPGDVSSLGAGETLSARNRFAAVVEELVAEGPLVRVRLNASPETPSPVPSSPRRGASGNHGRRGAARSSYSGEPLTEPLTESLTEPLTESLTGPVRLQALVTRPACGALGLQPGERVEVLVKAAAIHLMSRRAATETAWSADPGNASSLARSSGDDANRDR
jgi:molybdate transport system ATP-binding protein